MWVRIHNELLNQVLLSKTDMRAGPTGTAADKITFGFNAGVLQTQFVEYDSIADSYTASSVVDSGSTLDTAPYSWMLVGVNYSYGASQTDIELTKDGSVVNSSTQAG